MLMDYPRLSGTRGVEPSSSVAGCKYRVVQVRSCMRRMKQKLVPLDSRASRPSGPIPPLLEVSLAPR